MLLRSIGEYEMIGTSFKFKGKTIGCFTVLRRAPKVPGTYLTVKWEVRCNICKKKLILTNSSLKLGICKPNRARCHWIPGHPLGHTYQGMISRCYEPNAHGYKNYGGRGIKVCKRWKYAFYYFIQDMMPTWKPELTLDRINVNKGYSKNNCRWATRKEQRVNSRNIRMITFKGKTMCYSDWERYNGWKPGNISERLDRGWSDIEAITTPIRITKTSGFSNKNHQ